MARLIVLVAVALAALWAGYWAVGSRAKSLVVERWAEDMRAQGWRVEWDDARVRGFPSRFDTVFEGIALADPEGRFAWEAPFLQLLALSYRPDRIIAVFPPEQRLVLPVGAFDVSAADMRASAAVAPGRTPPLARATLVGEGVTWEGPVLGGLAAGQVAVRAAEGEGAPAHGYDVAAFAADLALPPGLAPPGLPDVIARVDLDATVGLAPPPAEGAPPEIDAAVLRALRVTWGDTVIGLSGALALDAQGRPEGVLDLTLAGWEPLLDALTAGRPAGQAMAARAFLGGMAVDGELRAELVLEDGQARIGLIPLGPVPALR